ncbi:MAG: TIGR03936 family radical SAM-associated protein [Acidimicrobiales bacterium]
MSGVSNVVMTVRLRYSKLGKIRFTSHRDIARVWERVLRRAEVPVALTLGFNPHARLSFGLALSTSHESVGEYLDIDLAARMGIDDLVARLGPVLPVGIAVQGAIEIAPGTPSLQQAVERSTWRIIVGGLSRAELTEQVARVVAAETLVASRERKGHAVVDDVRPAIVSLTVGDDRDRCEDDGFEDGIELIADLATQARGLRPSELVGLIGPEAIELRTCRLHQWISTDGALTEPLALATPATSLRALEECAS